MTSGYIPASGEPGPDEILTALREAIREDPGLRERRAEEISRDLASRGYLEREPSPTLVAEMLGPSNAKRSRDAKVSTRARKIWVG
jgi:hypothetical protein